MFYDKKKKDILWPFESFINFEDHTSYLFPIDAFSASNNILLTEINRKKCFNKGFLHKIQKKDNLHQKI